MISQELLACTITSNSLMLKLNKIFTYRHGEPWRQFRSRVQKPVLQLSTVRRYVQPLEEVTDYFIERCEQMLDENKELPDDFDNEIHKWSLECKISNSLGMQFNRNICPLIDRYWSSCIRHSFGLSRSYSRYDYMLYEVQMTLY